MAFESMSTENQIQNGLRELDASLNFFAALQDDVSVSTLQKALNGTRVLENDYAAPLLRLLRELQSIQRECVPYPVAFKVENVALFRELLATRRQQEPKPAEALFNIYLVGAGTAAASWFESRKRNSLGKPEIQASAVSGATLTLSDATEIAKRLAAEGYRASIVPARQSSDIYADDLDVVWQA
jgi:hypothetical protein